MRKIKNLLIVITLIFAVLIVAINILDLLREEEKQIPIVEEEIISDEYIINREMVLGKITSEAQLITLTQEFHDVDEYIDDGFFGERRTEMSFKGRYKLGLNTDDIMIKHIDSENRIAYIQMPEPTLISLEIPYDEIDFEKVKGLARRVMNEDERKRFYLATEENVRKEIMKNKDVIKQAKIMNESEVSRLLKEMGIQSIVFEEGDK